MAIIKIAVDSGKFDTKAVLAVNSYDEKKDRTLKFRTSVSERVRNTADSGQMIVTFDKKTYDVGTLKKKMYDPNSSKDTFTHKLCIYSAIGRLIDQDNADVSIAIGCPLDIFSNSRLCTEYLNNMLPIGETVNISINGVDKAFTIRDSCVCPESSGIVYLNMREFKDEIINVVDIGGLNVNGCQYDRLSPIVTSMFTDTLGGSTLLDDLREYLILSHGADRGNLADNILENMFEKNGIRNIKDSSEILKSLKKEKARLIYDACREKGWDTDFTRTVFIGGSALLLKDELKELFKADEADFCTDAVFANAKGFLRCIRRKQVQNG